MGSRRASLRPNRTSRSTFALGERLAGLRCPVSGEPGGFHSVWEALYGAAMVGRGGGRLACLLASHLAGLQHLGPLRRRAHGMLMYGSSHCNPKRDRGAAVAPSHLIGADFAPLGGCARQERGPLGAPLSRPMAPPAPTPAVF